MLSKKTDGWASHSSLLLCIMMLRSVLSSPPRLAIQRSPTPAEPPVLATHAILHDTCRVSFFMIHVGSHSLCPLPVLMEPPPPPDVSRPLGLQYKVQLCRPTVQVQGPQVESLKYNYNGDYTDTGDRLLRHDTVLPCITFCLILPVSIRSSVLQAVFSNFGELTYWQAVEAVCKCFP